MTDTLFLDYETFSSCDLKKAGAYRYAEDDSTEILCAGFAMGDDEPTLATPDSAGELHYALSHARSVTAHNAEFERCITNGTGGAKWGLPRLKINSIFCTAAAAAAKGYPRSLGPLADYLGLSEGKDTAGTRLINKLCKPRGNARVSAAASQINLYTSDGVDYHRWTPDTAPQDFEDLYNYCKQDVIVLQAVHAAIGDLSKSELKVFRDTVRTNQRGIPIDRNLVACIVEMRNSVLSKIAHKAVRDKPFNTLGQRAKVMAWCADTGYPLSGYTADDLDEALSDPHCPKEVRKVLSARRDCSRTSLNKLDKMLTAVCRDGTIKGGFLYYGAHTGRWSGRLIQPQNLPRPMISEDEITKVMEHAASGKYKKVARMDDPAGAMVSCVRGVIQPEPGLRMFASDFSNIEVRVLFSLAECISGLQVFSSGRDIYLAMAGGIYKVSYDDVLASYKGGDDSQRRLGKYAILGLGYQMGAPKFRDTCAGFGTDITSDLSKKVVNIYRSTYSEIPKFWSDCESAALSAVRRVGKRVHVNKYISYKSDGDVLRCRLPSGREIYYRGAKAVIEQTRSGMQSYKLQFEASSARGVRLESTFGGSLVENITQAIARDLLVSSEEATRKAGYKTRMTVHDELVLTTDRKSASAQEVDRLMVSNLPDYAASWPIDAESWEGERFRK